MHARRSSPNRRASSRSSAWPRLRGFSRAGASLPDLGGLAAGAAAAVAYDAWQASRLDVSLSALLRAGNDDFWLARGDAARLDALAGGDWIGEGARLVVVLGLAYGIGRAAGGGPRRSLQIATAAALAWSVAGPLIADGSLGYPFDGSVLGIAGWLGVAAALVAAAFVVEEDSVSRRTYVALLVWLAPVAVLWAWQRPDETRLLAPAWPALALLAAAALTCVSLALLRVRPAAALVPAAALAVVAVSNVVAVDGLGRSGWRDLLDLGPSGWSDRAEMENFAYGPFSYHLNLARENVSERRPNRVERRPPDLLLPRTGRGAVRAHVLRARRLPLLLVPLRRVRASSSQSSSSNRPTRSAGSSARIRRSSSSDSRRGSTRRSS